MSDREDFGLAAGRLLVARLALHDAEEAGRAWARENRHDADSGLLLDDERPIELAARIERCEIDVTVALRAYNHERQLANSTTPPQPTERAT